MKTEAEQQNALRQAVGFEILDIAEAGLAVRFIEHALDALGADEFVWRLLDSFDDHRT